MLRILALSLALLPATAQAQSGLAPETAAILQQGLAKTADAFILPGYEALSDSADALLTALDGYCGADAPLEVVQDAFAETFLAWQRVSIVQTGPVMDDEGPMRVQFWPDPKGFSRRAVRAAVRAEDPALLWPDGLTGRSIALTNLTALESLLYADLPRESYTCGLASSIARYQAGLAAGFAEAWTPGAPYRAEYDAPAESARYGSVDALVREMLAGFVVYTDTLRKKRIQRGLGLTSGEARAERTEAARSGLGLAAIAVQFRTLGDFYNLPGGFFDVTPDAGGTTEYYMLGLTAAGIADTLEAQDTSLTAIAEEDGALADEIRGFAEMLLFHEDYLKAGLPGALGMTTGFSSADGD